MRHLRLIALLSASTAIGGAAPAIAQSDFDPIVTSSQDNRIVPVSEHFQGITVFSEQELRQDGPPANDRYYLTALIDGQQQRLPIAPRSGVPFDVDLGPDGDGGVVAAYSRCAPEPDVITVRDSFGARVFSGPYPAYTSGRGCDLYRFDFDTMTESKIQGASTDDASEMLPSIWGDDVAFTRVYERRDGNRGAYPYLYVRPLDGGRSERQPGGSRGTNGLPGPVGLDLYGRRLSFVWNYSTGEPSEGDIAGTTEVRLDTVGGDNEVLSQADFDDQPASYIGPTGSAGRIFYGFQRVQPRGEATPTSVTSLLLRHRITSGERSLEDDVPSFLIDTTTDGRQTILGLREDAFGFGGATSTLQRSTSVDYDD